MKMGKATAEDLEMAMTLDNYLGAIDGGYMPDGLAEDKDNIEFLDSNDCEQYARLIHGLQELLDKGSISRVIWGMAVVCDPANRCIDPDAATIERHPDYASAIEQRDELLAALTLCEGNISSLAASHPVIYTGWLTTVRNAIAKAEAV